MAKDTEKLIRQLSLISFLMAERRPVSALEIKQDVEGYSEMNDDAFARRFYADRAELEGLGISLKVEKPPEGYFEAELYTLPPENFYLPPIEFTTASWRRFRRRCRCSTAASPTPSRCGWRCSSSPGAARARSARPSSAPSPWRSPPRPAGGSCHSGWPRSRPRSRAARRSSSATTRSSATSTRKRKVDPYHLLYQGGQFYLVGHSHERDDIRVFRLSRIREKISYASKAEHDFSPPEDFDPGATPTAPTGSSAPPTATPAIWISERIAWLVERDFGRYGDGGAGQAERQAVASRLPARARAGRGVHDRVRASRASSSPGCSGSASTPRLLRPARAGRGGVRAARATLVERHSETPADFVAKPAREPGAAREANGAADDVERRRRRPRDADPPGALRAAGRARGHPDPGRAQRASGSRSREVRERLQLSEQELREDVDLLNVVNFGGGSYVLYAEIQGDEIDVDPEPYSDNFARPARLLPLEAKALVAAIDLLGDHLPEGSLGSARDKIVDGARRRPGAGRAADRAHDPRRHRAGAHDQRRDRRRAAC